MIRFLACDFHLLELDEQEASASLTAAFQLHFGYLPDFGGGDAVAGCHRPGDEPRELVVAIQRKANRGAARRALSLLTVRHKLDSVRIVTRLLATNTIRHDDWLPDVDMPPYNHDAVSVWPAEPTHPIRDHLVVEHVNERGRFVHRLAASRPMSLDHIAADSVEDALVFVCVEEARAWINEFGERHLLRVLYRAVALAEEDQDIRRVDEGTQG